MQGGAFKGGASANACQYARRARAERNPLPRRRGPPRGRSCRELRGSATAHTRPPTHGHAHATPHPHRAMPDWRAISSCTFCDPGRGARGSLLTSGPGAIGHFERTARGAAPILMHAALRPPRRAARCAAGAGSDTCGVLENARPCGKCPGMTACGKGCLSSCCRLCNNTCV
ncbi:MAG: hypothetical protein J3K34DRAFT_423591, partial [Monoraphidium minutum]